MTDQPATSAVVDRDAPGADYCQQCYLDGHYDDLDYAPVAWEFDVAPCQHRATYRCNHGHVWSGLWGSQTAAVLAARG